LPRYRHAVLGGTFDRFHLGHAALLARAFFVGRQVSIGVTTDAFLAAHPKPLARRIQPYAVRRQGVLRWIRSHYPTRLAQAVQLSNPFGRSIELGYDVLVVSADTRAGGRAVNVERHRRHRPPIPIEVVPVVLADDLQPISSRRIRAGEIDRRGRRLTRVQIALTLDAATASRPVIEAVRAAFPTAVLRRQPRRPHVRASEIGAAAREALRGRDLSIAVARRTRGGWIAVERSGSLALRPRAIPGAAPVDLRRGVLSMLRPDLATRQKI
jgi:pantetheine-phosphate adenylyltransferase